MVGRPVYGQVHLHYEVPTLLDEVGVWVRGQVVTPAFGEAFLMQEWIERGLSSQPSQDHFVRFSFELPPGSPPTYHSESAKVFYEMLVRPKEKGGEYPDEDEFTWKHSVLVNLPPEPPRPQRPVLSVTSNEGMLRSEPFMEVALDTADISLGDAIRGSISLANVKHVRGVDITLYETEVTHEGTSRPGREFRTRILDGAPAIGEPIRFDIEMPERATPTFETPSFKVVSAIEARADVAWAEDVVLTIPVVVTPLVTERPTYQVVGTGHEREIAQWESVAAANGFVVDRYALKMHGRRGAVSIEIGNTNRDTGPWSYAKLGWSPLGVGLHVREKRWRDVLLAGATREAEVLRVDDEHIDARLIVRARERAQVKDVIDASLLGKALAFDEIAIDDAGAELASPGSPIALDALARFVTNAIEVAGAFDAIAAHIPPPAVVPAAHLEAWQAYADRVHGRLARGRMWIHGARAGTATFDVGCEWPRAGVFGGATVRVTIDPPLEVVPKSKDEPSISPVARNAWQALLDRDHTPVIEPTTLTVHLAGGEPLADPHHVQPIIDLAVGLSRALAGIPGGGPFR